MCGHVGIAGLLEHKDEATMKRLLLYDFFRGMDSTGFVGVRFASQEAQIAKVASHPLDLFDMKKFDKALSASACSVFMGHNRAATKGGVTAANAHPYEFGHIIGAHNGTLTVTSHMDLEESLGEKYDVDSQAIFAHIERFGIHKTAPLLQGAWALVWYDKVLNTLNFLRNKERSFWCATSEDHTKVFWASEWPMIQAATALSSSEYKLYSSVENYKFFATEENELYTFDLDKLRSKQDTDYPLDYAKCGQLKGKEPAPVVNYSAGVTPFHRHGTGKTTTEIKTSKTIHGSTGNVFIRLVGDKDDPFAGYLSNNRLEEMASFGCSWCYAPIAPEDVGLTVVDHDDIILCKDCSVDPTMNRLVVSEMPPVPSHIQSLLNQIA